MGPIVPLMRFFFLKIQMFLAPVPVSLSVKFYISPTRRMPKANFLHVCGHLMQFYYLCFSSEDVSGVQRGH